MRIYVVKSDGSVPFHADLSEENRKLLIADMVEDGHAVQFNAFPHPLYEHQDSGHHPTHAVLLNGPNCKAEQDKRRAELSAKAVSATGKPTKSKG